MVPSRSVSVFLMLALLGCPTEEPPGSDDDATTVTDDDDDVTPTIAASAELSEGVSAVVKVHWTVDGPSPDATWAEFGAGEEMDRRAVAVPGEEEGYEALVWGVKPGTELKIRAVVEVGDVRHTSETLTVTTGYPPTHLPEAEVTTYGDGSSVGGYLITSVITDPSVAVILDRDGDYVWWHTLEDELDSVLISRAHLSLDGRTMMYLASTTPTGGGTSQVLVRLPYDGSEVNVTEVPGAHHDFTERGDGKLALIALDGRDVDGELIQGDQIIEQDPMGTQTTIWSAWDHLEYDPDEPAPVGTGWTHANALDHDADNDLYYLSLRNRNSILAIDRATGALLSVIGGEGSHYTDASGYTGLFEWPHQFQLLDGSILAFSSGSAPWFRSEALEYTLDKDAGLADLVWSYTADPPLYSVGYGDASRLPGGHTLITWSAQGQIDEVDEAAELLWQLNLDLGGGLGYVTHVDTLPGLDR